MQCKAPFPEKGIELPYARKMGDLNHLSENTTWSNKTILFLCLGSSTYSIVYAMIRIYFGTIITIWDIDKLEAGIFCSPPADTITNLPRESG